MSTDSARVAAEAGYTNVKVLLAGVPGWKKAGNHIVASQEFVETGNIVLVDLRSEDAYAKGHIPRAHSIPFADFPDAEWDLPENTSAPVVVYGDNAAKASKMARKWGYKAASVYEGGVNTWVKAGKKLDTSASPDEIVWVRILEPGEVSIADFVKASKGQLPGAVILDVRTSDEIKEGMFANAIHVPLDEIGAKMATLPKDKELLIHCTTGARAEMAFQELKKAGFKTRYVVGNIECDPAEGCEISE